MLRKASIVLLILYSGLLFAQTQAVPLKNGESSAYMGGTVALNHVYVSIEDLSSALGLRRFSLGSTGKVSVYSNSGSILFTPDNSFITLSKAAVPKTYQLPLPILENGGKLYAPASFIGPYLTEILGGVLRYDELTRAFTYMQRDSLTPMITDVRVQQKDNGSVVHISLSSLPKAEDAALGEDGMLYVTIMPATFNFEKLNSLPPTSVYSNVLAIQNPSSVQLSFRLKKAYNSEEVYTDSSTNSVVVNLYSHVSSKTILSDELRQKLDAEKKNWKLDVIVIDPGHGGKDPGAIGLGGVEEKNVTLAIGKDLRNDLRERLPKVKVVMTRDKDEFVPLDMRGEIANQAAGKLFISIHCNSMPHKPDGAHGLETYFLRPGKTEEAIRIAAQENAAIKYENDYEKKYRSYDADNLILTSMAHSAYVKYSERFAELIEQDVSSITPLTNDGVGQAGFLVLIGASMPAVLVETGYLSNPHDVRFLRSKVGQNKIARGITEAIIQFRAEYEKNFAQE